MRSYAQKIIIYKYLLLLNRDVRSMESPFSLIRIMVFGPFTRLIRLRRYRSKKSTNNKRRSLRKLR